MENEIAISIEQKLEELSKRIEELEKSINETLELFRQDQANKKNETHLCFYH